MKHLITATASLMILLAFLMEFIYVQALHHRIAEADLRIAEFHQAVKMDGCISAQEEERLKEDLSDITACAEQEIVVEGTRMPVFRGMRADYRVGLPMKGIIAAPGFWGLKEEDNQFYYQVQRSVSSEYLGRQP